jgi:hypothetical protein
MRLRETERESTVGKPVPAHRPPALKKRKEKDDENRGKTPVAVYSFYLHAMREDRCAVVDPLVIENGLRRRWWWW